VGELLDKILRRKGGNPGMGWRTKFVFVLIVYCAGFATAVYCLAPTPEPGEGPPLQLAKLPTTFKSEELVRSVSSGIHKCVDLSKEAAEELAKRIQNEIEKARSGSKP
jgi:hypothetical protein